MTMLEDRIAELETRQQELLTTIVRLTNEVPFPDEIKGWTDQRAKILAEIGTLRARIDELEKLVEHWKSSSTYWSDRYWDECRLNSPTREIPQVVIIRGLRLLARHLDEGGHDWSNGTDTDDVQAARAWIAKVNQSPINR